VFSPTRSGLTLVEVMIFMTIFGVVLSLLIPTLFTIGEKRYDQKQIAIVEQAGSKLLQDLTQEIRTAERIRYPASLGSGNYLVLSSGSGSADPTIIGMATGSLAIIHRTNYRLINPPSVGISNFWVRNTSISSSIQSLLLSFDVSRVQIEPVLKTIKRSFTGAVWLPPADNPTGNACSCPAVSCNGGLQVRWRLCQSGSCASTTYSWQMRCL
jgi:type II secretory pathway pseudopilin PulG